jgi:acyl-CoA dehydrogenase
METNINTQNFSYSVNRFLNKEFVPYLKEWEELGYFPNSVFTKLGEEGYLGILISEKYGGIGGDYNLAAEWCREFGKLPDVGLTTAVNMHSLVISHAIDKTGTEVTKDLWLPNAVSGNKIGAYAFSEPGAGSDLRKIRTKAIKKGDNWYISGSKTFITNGKRADFVLLLAKTSDSENSINDDHFTTFVIDTKSSGFKVNKTLDKLGWRSSDTAEIFLDNVMVPGCCILGKVGDGWKQASENLNWERLMLSLLTIAGMEVCYKEALSYAHEREAFSKKLIDIPTINNYLQEMKSRIILDNLMIKDTLNKFTKNENCRREVSATKRIICDDAVYIADLAIQIHGGYGYTKEYSAEKWWRDLRIMKIGGGTSEIMGNIIRKELK